MGLFDSFFHRQTVSSTQATPSKISIERQIDCVETLISCFQNSMLDDIRKARMVKNMRTFKATLAYLYEDFKYGKIRDVLKSNADFESVANIAIPLVQLKMTNKVQYQAILQNTLESWESHISAIKAIGLTDSRVQQEKEDVDGITNTLKYAANAI